MKQWSDKRPADCIRRTSTFSPFDRKIWFPDGTVKAEKKCYRQIDVDVPHTKKDVTIKLYVKKLKSLKM